MIKVLIQRILNARGFEIIRMATSLTSEEQTVLQRIKGLTATSPWRVVGLMDAVKYITRNRIEGAIVECGVWRGGSVMAALYTLVHLGDTSREVYLYDTFEGMTPPTDKDVMFDGTPAESLLRSSEKKEDVDNYWCYAGVEAVRKSVLSTGYPSDKVHFVKGKVEDTLPSQAPQKVALLRLDTDWYDSTKHELAHLYPRLADRGVLILDDYGHWEGARKAVDEYFDSLSFRPFLSRLDYSGRLVIKVGL